MGRGFYIRHPTSFLRWFTIRNLQTCKAPESSQPFTGGLNPKASGVEVMPQR
jgi:hypothetical protein